MKAVRPGMKDTRLRRSLNKHFAGRCAGPSYTSIVGAGANATVLHYINNDGELRDGELLLVDAGAEYKGYASDIHAHFSDQRPLLESSARIYDLVLETQMSCVEMVRPGVTHDELKNHSVKC